MLDLPSYMNHAKVPVYGVHGVSGAQKAAVAAIPLVREGVAACSTHHHVVQVHYASLRPRNSSMIFYLREIPPLLQDIALNLPYLN